MTSTCLLTPRHQRGPLKVSGERYGLSALGAPLLYFPAEHTSSDTGLILVRTEIKPRQSPFSPAPCERYS